MALICKIEILNMTPLSLIVQFLFKISLVVRELTSASPDHTDSMIPRHLGLGTQNMLLIKIFSLVLIIVFFVN